MSRRDGTGKRRKRRSLRVPVDEVPRKQVSEATDSSTETSSTKTPPSETEPEASSAPNDGSVTQSDGAAASTEPQSVGAETIADAEPIADEEIAARLVSEDASEGATAEPADSPSESEAVAPQAIGIEAGEDVSTATEAVVEAANASSESSANTPPVEKPSAKKRGTSKVSVGKARVVRVQRVVAVAKTSSDAAVDDDEALESGRISDVSIDVEYGDEVPSEDSTSADLLSEDALVDSGTLPLDDLELEEDEETNTASLPPPPPTNPVRVDAPPPPPRPAASAVTGARTLPKQWWEELFSDDYLRTVPIPNDRVIRRECDFIVERLGLAPRATILDVGCGLGLHAVELTRRGFLVVGLDYSLPMLSRAADEARDHGLKINFLHGDMRDMTFDGAFDAVLCWGTTFSYFDDEMNKRVVERLYSALKPRGLLLLDVVNRDYVLPSQPNLVWFTGDGCKVMEETRCNFITSRLEVKRSVIFDDGSGQRENRYSLRLYALHELGQLLHNQGFRVLEVSGRMAHPGVFFGPNSPRIIITALRRPPAAPPTPSSADRDAGAQTMPLDDDIDDVAIEADGEVGTSEDDAGSPEHNASPDAAGRDSSAAVDEALAEVIETSSTVGHDED